MSFLNELTLLLKARYPILYISTYEEERLEYIVKYCTKKYVSRTYYSWDYVDGYQGNPNDNGFAAKNPLAALELIERISSETGAVFVLKDYEVFLKDYSINRKLKNVARSLKTQPKNIIIVSSEISIPDTLREFITVVDFPLPTYKEIQEELQRLMNSLKQEISNDLLVNLTTACQGLSLERIRRVLSKVIAQSGNIENSTPKLVLDEKKQIIQQTQLLDFILANNNITDLGGLDNFKDWLKLRAEAFLPGAKEYGLPYPKGLLLAGVQGTGKSLAAKTVAKEWNLPLLRLDFGRLFASLIGQSESRVRQMIQIAESLSPCVLWVDEIDKAFAGIQSNGDSGTTSRVLATFLTWMSEKTSPVFVVATANNITWIPAEIIRKGRFDEVFFLALPTKEEREAIFEVHLKKVRPERLNEFSLPLLSELSKDFSGAEIEQVVIEAMRIGYNQGREFVVEDILESIQKVVPLARTKNRELEELKEWFESGNVLNASKY